MKLYAVTSSNIAAVGWHDGKLRVEFHNGGVYDYQGVSEAEFKVLKDSDSVGRYFERNIRNQFPTTKVS